MAMVPELAQVLEPGQGLASQAPELPVLAPGLAWWRPAARRAQGPFRRRFCQKHNTQQWPG
ncbi:hypothetical protein MPLB_690021 [Mesorhizobium sp. ORS 3324]|nr:hypothetical protein MPLB_690021 [Mesorhizobium sp. ORS 3324]